MGIFDLFKKQPAPETKQPEAEKAPVAESTSAAESAEATQPPQPAQPAGFFSRLKSALKKTTDLLNTDIRDLFKKEGRLVDDEMLDQLYAILIRTDMGVGPAGKIRDRVKSEFRGRVVHLHEVIATVKSELREIVAQPEVPIVYAEEGPTVVLVVGVNGSGKTTSIAKLTNYFRSQGKSVVLGAGDTFRAAACEQLTIWAERLGATIVKGEAGGDPAAVAHRAVATAVSEKMDVCIIDTAGRLQTQTNLMQQLEKIHRVIGKQVPAAPHEVLLVLDATAGQNAISQAQGFSTAAHCTGIVLAKLDGSAKGGVVIPIREKFSIPVKFIGLGEKATDLALFNSDQFVDALFEEARS